MGPIVIGVFDPIKSLALLEEREGGKRVRKYRVMCGRSASYWVIELTQDGKIAAMRPSSE